jgi:hypothetical protein
VYEICNPDLNREYSDSIRFRLYLYHRIKQAGEKENIERSKDIIRSTRKSLKRHTYGDNTVIEDSNDSATLIYKVLFNGTKRELLDYLWENRALRIENSQYDCTGQVFTSKYVVAHISNNLWKVAETRLRDV